jgi:hypothetical protein
VSKKGKLKYTPIGKLTKSIGLVVVVEAFSNNLQNRALKLLAIVILQSVHSQPRSCLQKRRTQT